MNKNPINEVAKTYQRLVEAAPPDPWDPAVGPIPPWEQSSGLFRDPNVSPYLQPHKPVSTGHQARLEEIEEILRSISLADDAYSNGYGRAKTIQMAVAALIAAGALAYLTYEELMQMVEDYFNPPIQPPYVQIDPQYHNRYVSPYQQIINNLGSEQGGYIPGGIFGP